MIILIAGASHTGKTKPAQSLLEKYKFPYLSIDHLKMGLIRCGIFAVIVLEKYRRRGIGGKLMDIAEQIAFSY